MLFVVLMGAEPNPSSRHYQHKEGAVYHPPCIDKALPSLRMKFHWCVLLVRISLSVYNFNLNGYERGQVGSRSPYRTYMFNPVFCWMHFQVYFGLSPPVKYFTDRSKAVLILWIFYVFLSCVCYAFVSVCLYVPCGHLLGKGWPLGSRLWCLFFVTLSLSHWYPGSGVVLDCIDS